jgi:hypothetical protein
VRVDRTVRVIVITVAGLWVRGGGGPDQSVPGMIFQKLFAQLDRTACYDLRWIKGGLRGE